MEVKARIGFSNLVPAFHSLVSSVKTLLTIQNGPDSVHSPGIVSRVLDLTSRLSNVQGDDNIKDFLHGHDLNSRRPLQHQHQCQRQQHQKRNCRRSILPATSFHYENEICIQPRPKRQRQTKLTIKKTERKHRTAVPLRVQLLKTQTLKRGYGTGGSCCQEECWKGWRVRRYQ